MYKKIFQRNTRHANRQRQANSVRAVPVEANEPPIIVQATEVIPDQSQRIRELEERLALKTELANEQRTYIERISEQVENQRIQIEGMIDTCKKGEQEIEDLHAVIDQHRLRLDKAHEGTLCAFQEEELRMLVRDMDKLEKDNMILLRKAEKVVEEGYSYEAKKAMALAKCMSNHKFDEGSIISYEGRWFVRISKQNADRLSVGSEYSTKVNTAEGLAAFNSS